MTKFRNIDRLVNKISNQLNREKEITLKVEDLYRDLGISKELIPYINNGDIMRCIGKSKLLEEYNIYMLTYKNKMFFYKIKN